MNHFLHIFIHYLREILPALAAGFLISGFVHEFIPGDKVTKYLGSGGVKPILWATLIGAILPVCCWGSLPIAVSFQKKGARLGPVLAFLVATPATSVSALFVSYSVLGPVFTAYTFVSVIAMGLVIGVVGDRVKYIPRPGSQNAACPHCEKGRPRARSALKYALFDMPREIGPELFLGLVLASFVATFVPIGHFVKSYLGGALGYLFAVVFGLLMYLCSTASVPLIDSLINRGMDAGAAMSLLLLGPVTSYGTILVLKKEYGLKVLSIFIISLTIMTTLLGMGYGLFNSLIRG